MLGGDVHRFKLPKGRGHEKPGDRFGVVLQADELLARSVLLVAPTSRRARAASFRPEIEVEATWCCSAPLEREVLRLQQRKSPRMDDDRTGAGADDGSSQTGHRQGAEP